MLTIVYIKHSHINMLIKYKVKDKIVIFIILFSFFILINSY